ncbi:FliH/SctL family protein [Novosphingobium huizhouense]|uniref:FliH/SctL family protein n=1 Tax=Novosphingobium huizhouense TaxID=2866625 RepID=UPI001CD82D8F|nr:FliH/SctL family protein [Novosphingobium huizhouense]
MSEMLHDRFAPPGARSFALAELLGNGASLFARDARFVSEADRTADEKASLQRAPQGIDEDPLQSAFADGYAQGAEDARRAAQVEAAERDAARHRIETGLARLDEAMVHQLQDRLRQTVLALCETVTAQAAIDADALARRVAAAAAMLARAEDARVIRLHPEDLALVHARLPEAWHCEPDPTLERGSIRVEGAHGGVEDGPEQWRRAIEDALRQC